MSTTDTLDSSSFQAPLPHHYRAILSSFRSISRSFVYFNLLFLLLLTVEAVLFLISFSAVGRSTLLVTALGALLITLFSYPILFYYYQAKKPEQWKELLSQFIDSSRGHLNLSADSRLSLAQTLFNLSQHLSWKDEAWNTPGTLSQAIALFASRSLFRDTLHFKELLLHEAVQEHVEQVRETPTDLEVHVSLANTYVALSRLYQDPATVCPSFHQKHASLLETKFKACVQLALEELQILSQFAPNDPWIHEQLAVGYRDLGLLSEEVRETETLLKLKPGDLSVLFRLGVLYFQQGANAKGLQVYAELKRAQFHEANRLMGHYGAAKSSLFEPVS